MLHLGPGIPPEIRHAVVPVCEHGVKCPVLWGNVLHYEKARPNWELIILQGLRNGVSYAHASNIYLINPRALQIVFCSH